tara:strand:- start:282 stop:1388 length:1107 start_codon:yes stop_codon:yes gene_type:complete
MLIQITITIPPSGIAGPFDLFSDADGYTSPFETQLPANDLENGYVVELPIGATIIRVCSVGNCENCIDIPTNCPTTTTTSSSSTSTTTSTSTSTSTSTTTTSTTLPPPYKFDWQLQTQTPTNIGTVNLTLTVDGLPVVNSTISVGNTTQSGQLLIQAGAIIQATMSNLKSGSHEFANKIAQNGVLYQPNDVCNPCTDELITPFFQSYVMESANQLFVFDGVITAPSTTTTTSSSSTSTTTTSSTSSTTTTTTTCDCSLNGLTATYITPVTTTTTTTPNTGNIDPGAISSNSNPTTIDCFLALDSICYIQHQAVGTISVGDRIFNNVSGTNPFVGTSRYYKIQLNTNASRYSARVDSNGYVLSPIGICP